MIFSNISLKFSNIFKYYPHNTQTFSNIIFITVFSIASAFKQIQKLPTGSHNSPTPLVCVLYKKRKFKK